MTTLLETEILNAIKPLLTPYLDKLNSHEFIVRPGFIEVKYQNDAGDHSHALLLRTDINHDQNQVRISDIVMPTALKGHSLGKVLLKAIYVVAKAHGCEVFVTDATPGFHERLLRRGANPRDGETVQINDDTVLA